MAGNGSRPSPRVNKDSPRQTSARHVEKKFVICEAKQTILYAANRRAVHVTRVKLGPLKLIFPLIEAFWDSKLKNSGWKSVPFGYLEASLRWCMNFIMRKIVFKITAHYVQEFHLYHWCYWTGRLYLRRTLWILSAL